jgi:hypothetical protein
MKFKNPKDGLISKKMNESTYKRDLAKRIELINWVLDNMKNSNINICEIIESKMYEILDKIKEMDSAIEADPLHSELRSLRLNFISSL